MEELQLEHMFYLAICPYFFCGCVICPLETLPPGEWDMTLSIKSCGIRQMPYKNALRLLAEAIQGTLRKKRFHEMQFGNR